MGCPAYREADPEAVTLPNGVAKMSTRAAATIYDYRSKNGKAVRQVVAKSEHGTPTCIWGTSTGILISRQFPSMLPEC